MEREEMEQLIIDAYEMRMYRILDAELDKSWTEAWQVGLICGLVMLLIITIGYIIHACAAKKRLNRREKMEEQEVSIEVSMEISIGPVYEIETKEN